MSNKYQIKESMKEYADRLIVANAILLLLKGWNAQTDEHAELLRVIADDLDEEWRKQCKELEKEQ